MITHLKLKGFKSWRDTGLMRLAPITALFGSNSSGKTSLLQALLMLKQTAESTDRSQVLNLGDERALVDLGTFQDLLFGHNPMLPVDLSLRWSLPEKLSIEDPSKAGSILFEGETLSYTSRIRWRNNGKEGLGRAVVDSLAYEFASHAFGMRTTGDDTAHYDLFETHPKFNFKRTRGRPWQLPPPAKCYGFPDQVRAYFTNAGFLSDFELRFEQMLARTYYLGPLRDYPKRQYTWAGSQPADMGLRGEKVVDALLASREAGPNVSRGRGKTRVTVEKRVAQWLKELGLIEHFEVSPVTSNGKLFQVLVRRHAGSAKVLITDVGFGVSQILPVITLCYYAPEGSTILLEQPEIHLHPKVQAGLADVFIDATKTRRIQILLESHSEHLLRRLQRRIAEETMNHEDAALYFCTMTGGESRLTPLAVDMYGAIENWPPDFFGDEFDEIARTNDAVLARKKRGR